jgi:hypothetical protein
MYLRPLLRLPPLAGNYTTGGKTYFFYAYPKRNYTDAMEFCQRDIGVKAHLAVYQVGPAAAALAACWCPAWAAALLPCWAQLPSTAGAMRLSGGSQCCAERRQECPAWSQRPGGAQHCGSTQRRAL